MTVYTNNNLLEYQYLKCDAPEPFPLLFDYQTLSNLLSVNLRTISWLLSKYHPLKNIHTNNYIRDYETISNNIKKGECLLDDWEIDKTKICYRKNNMYTQFIRITKGKKRHITAPRNELKYVQKKIAEEILSKYDLPDCVYGFRQGKSVADVGRLLSNSPLICGFDIVNFFPSIKQWMVQDIFKRIGYNDYMCKQLSEILCFKASLPQGSPASPALSNILGAEYFDKDLKELAELYGFEYIRYVDNVVFYTKDKAIAKTRGLADELISKGRNIVYKRYFKTHKVEFRRNHKRQVVFGVKVNEAPTVKDYMDTKAAVYDSTINGISAACLHQCVPYQHRAKPEAFINWLRGKLNFFKMINPIKAEDLLLEFQAAIERFRNNTNIGHQSILNILE